MEIQKMAAVIGSASVISESPPRAHVNTTHRVLSVGLFSTPWLYLQPPLVSSFLVPDCGGDGSGWLRLSAAR